MSSNIEKVPVLIHLLRTLVGDNLNPVPVRILDEGNLWPAEHRSRLPADLDTSSLESLTALVDVWHCDAEVAESTVLLFVATLVSLE